MEKKCTKCEEVKSLDEFSNDKKGKDGKDVRCKSCAKKYYEKNKKVDIIGLQFIRLFQLNNGLKKCSKCGEIKLLDDFSNAKKEKNGKRFDCKICVNKSTKEYREKNKEKIKECREKNKHITKEWRKNNRETLIQKSKTYYLENKFKINEKSKTYYLENKQQISVASYEYRKENKEKIKGIHKEYYKNNKDKLKDRSRTYYNGNKEKVLEYQKQYGKNNRDTINTWTRKYKKSRKITDPLYKLKFNIGTNIRTALTKKGYTKKTKTFNILKCDYNFFMDWLNGIAGNGYTYGIGNLHLDHVIPISLAETEDEAYLLSHYSNYQLLSADENMAKGNRYVNPLNLARVLEHHPNPDKIREIHARL